MALKKLLIELVAPIPTCSNFAFWVALKFRLVVRKPASPPTGLACKPSEVCIVVLRQNYELVWKKRVQ